MTQFEIFAGIAVFALNPKQLDRFSPAGAKDDRRDALVLADSLATDRKAFREAPPPEIVRLRELSRTDGDLVEERTRLTDKLKAQIRRYYPAFLEAAPDLGRTWALDLWTLAPTPRKARRVRLPSVEAALGKSRASAEDVLAALRDKPVPTAPGTAEAVAESAGRIVRRLKALNAEIKDVRSEIKQEFKTNEFNGRISNDLVFENNSVRVWHISLEPGERLPVHRHVLTCFWTAVTQGRFLQRTYD